MNLAYEFDPAWHEQQATAEEDDAFEHVQRMQDLREERGSRWAGALPTRGCKEASPDAETMTAGSPSSRPALPDVITAAFERAGLPAPNPERVDRFGYSAQEIKHIDAEAARRRKEEVA